VSLVAIVLTFALITYQRHVVRRTGSLAIGTDRLHYASDLMLNASVIVALVLDQFANLTGADALFGLLIASWLLWGAWRASSHAFDQLMDKEWPAELRARFLAAAKEYPELAGLHDLRTRTSGTHHFAQFHVWVPADWTVREAHDRLDRVEEQLRERFPETEILIHVDPEGQTDRETMLSSDITESAT
jgi:ferrous-iron efflux pump FieF